MKKKTKLLFLAAMISVFGFATAGCSGCKESQSGGNVGGTSVVFDVEELLTAPAGEYFSIPSPVCLDENGKMYFPTAEVKDPSGNPVILDNGVFFVAVEGDYSLTYSVKCGEEIQTKTVVVRAADNVAPSLYLAKTELWGIQGLKVEFPTYSVTDSFCEANEISVETAVYYGEEEVGSDATGFIPDRVGEYKIVYTAKDAKNNVSPEYVVKVKCVEKEAGNLTYYNQQFGADGVKVPSGNSVETSTDRTIGEDEYSLKFTLTSAGNYWGNGSVKLNTAYVKDVSSYDKITFSVYSAVDETKGFIPSVYMHNGTEGTSAIKLTPNEWTDVTFYRDGTVWKLEGGSYGIAVTETDISNLSVCFNYGKAESTNPQSIYYISTLRAAKSAVIEMPSTIATGQEFTIPQASVDGATEGVTQEVYIDGSATAHTASTVTFATAGEHTFIFKVKKNGELVDTQTFKVYVYQSETGNLTYYNESFGATGVTVGGTASGNTVAVSDEHVLTGDDYSLAYTVVPAANYWASANVSLSNVYEKDVSGYDKITFSVWADVDTEQTFTAKLYMHNGSEGTSVVVLNSDDWTHITFYRDGNVWKLENANGDVGIAITETDISNLKIYISYGAAQSETNPQATYYISTLRAAKSAVIEMPSTIATGQEFTIPQASLSGTTEGVTQEVYIDGSATAHTASTVTFATAGEHTFIFKVKKNGELVDTQTFKVYVYQSETGNLTYYNQSTGANSVTVGGTVSGNTVIVSDSHILPWDDYSLAYTVVPAANYWASANVSLSNVYEKDVSGYDKITFSVWADVDTEQTFTAKLYMHNGSEGTSVVVLNSDDWTHITFYRDGNVWKLENANGDVGIAITETDISNLQIYISYGAAQSETNPKATYYISTLRASKATAVNMDTDTIFTEQAVNLPTVSYDGSTEGVTTELYIDGSTTAHTDSTITFTTEGTHILLFKVMKDGNFVSYVQKAVTVIQSEAGNLTYYNKSFGANGVTVGGTASGNTVAVSDEHVLTGDDYSLAYTVVPAANYWASGNVSLSNVYEKDVSAYDKITFSVWADVDTTQTFTAKLYMHNGSEGTSVVVLNSDDWTHITFYRDGNVWKLENANGDVGIAITETDISNLQIYISYGAAQSETNPKATYYISTLRASNTAE